MEIYDLIILHGQIASLTLEVGDLHVHGTRQRHPYRVGIVPPVAPPTRDQRYVQPRHYAPQLLLHALGARYRPIVYEVIPAPLLTFRNRHPSYVAYAFRSVM
jgi:hypothetical protein